MTKRVNSAVAAAVVAGLQAAAASPSVAIEPQAVRAATDAVLRELGPTVENLTNAEPLWRSRVVWGALLSAIGATAALIGVPIAAELQSRILDVIMLWVTLIGLVSGPALTLWGRLRARKPIGGSPTYEPSPFEELANARAAFHEARSRGADTAPAAREYEAKVRAYYASSPELNRALSEVRGDGGWSERA